MPSTFHYLVEFDPPEPLPLGRVVAKTAVILAYRRCAVQVCPQVTPEVAVWRLLCALGRDCVRLARRLGRTAERALDRITFAT